MNLNKHFTKSISFLCILILIMALFCSCASDTKEDKKYDLEMDSSMHIKNPTPVGPGTPYVKRLEPDVSKIKLDKASKDVSLSKDEKALVDNLIKFSNPNGNEYDALSILGDFRYSDKTKEEMMKKLKNASKDWHDDINKNVGEKCIINIDIENISKLDDSNENFKDWKMANTKVKATNYSQIECEITTNYSTGKVSIMFDAVCVDGAWYLANTSTLNKIKNIVVTEIF